MSKNVVKNAKKSFILKKSETWKYVQIRFGF